MIKIAKNRLGKLYASLTLLSVEMIAVLFAFACSLTLFVLVVTRIFVLKKDNFDFKIFDFLSGFVSPFATNVMQFFTFFGSHMFLIPANLVLICYFLFIKKHTWYSIKVPVVAISSLILMFSLKYIFNRPRPLIPLLKAAGGLSFPSGHAFMSFSFFGLLIFLAYRYVNKKSTKWIVIIGLALFIFMIGLSRIYLRVHYASDVMAGFAVGLMWLVVSLWTLKKLERYSRQKIATRLTPRVESVK